jgi:hypothetical protein
MTKLAYSLHERIELSIFLWNTQLVGRSLNKLNTATLVLYAGVTDRAAIWQWDEEAGVVDVVLRSEAKRPNAVDRRRKQASKS